MSVKEPVEDTSSPLLCVEVEEFGSIPLKTVTLLGDNRIVEFERLAEHRNPAKRNLLHVLC